MKDTIQEHLDVIKRIDTVLLAELEKVVELCCSSLRNGKKLIFCGNGGSAADAQHLAAEFVVRFSKSRPAIAAISLATDTSILTACGNDFSYEEVFARQVEALGKKGDVIFVISTSGNSSNMIRAVEEARKQNLYIVGITGNSDSMLATICDTVLSMPSSNTARIQESYMLLGHILCGEIEDRIFE